MSIYKLPSSELKVMQYIWSQSKKNSSKEIIIEMSEKNNWKQTTTLTVLSRLKEKKFLKVEKIGRYSYYEPLIEEDTYIDYETSNFMDTFYQGSLKKLLSSLNDKCKIEKNQLEDIEDWLTNLKKDK